MEKARQHLAKTAKSTGPREETRTTHLTWLDKKQRMRAEFRTQISDGVYRYVQGVDGLPTPGIRTGTQFGVRGGAIYEADRNGELFETKTIPFAPFVLELPPPR